MKKRLKKSYITNMVFSIYIYIDTYNIYNIYIDIIHIYELCCSNSLYFSIFEI